MFQLRAASPVVRRTPHARIHKAQLPLDRRRIHAYVLFKSWTNVFHICVCFGMAGRVRIEPRRVRAPLHVRNAGERALSSVCWQAGGRSTGPSHCRAGSTCSCRGVVTGRLRILGANACRGRFSAAAVRPGNDDAHSADHDRSMVCCRAGAGNIACRARPPGWRGYDPVGICSDNDRLRIPCWLGRCRRCITCRWPSICLLGLSQAARTSWAAVNGEKEVA